MATATTAPVSVTLDHPHPSVNGVEKRHAPIYHRRNAAPFQMAYSLESAGNAASTKFRGYVLCIHGFTCTGHHWRYIATELAALGYTVMYYDHPGVGHSEHPSLFPTLTMDDMASFAEQLVNYVWGLHTPLSICGFSMGGMIAQCLAARLSAPGRPSRVASLNLFSTHVGGWRNKLPPLKGLYGVGLGISLKRDPAAKATKASIPTNMTRSQRNRIVDQDGTREWQRYRDYLIAAWEAHPPMRGQALIGQVAALISHNFTADHIAGLKARIKGPVLVVTGDTDNMVRPRNSKLLADALGASYFVFPNTGHDVLVAHPQDVLVLLSANLAKAGTAHFNL